MRFINKKSRDLDVLGSREVMVVMKVGIVVMVAVVVSESEREREGENINENGRMIEC